MKCSKLFFTMYYNPPSTPSLYSEQNCLIGFNNDVFLKILQQIQKRNFSKLTNEILIKKKKPHKLQTFKVIHKD